MRYPGMFAKSGVGHKRQRQKQTTMIGKFVRVDTTHNNCASTNRAIGFLRYLSSSVHMLRILVYYCSRIEHAYNVSISVLSRIATRPFRGAGKRSGNSNRENRWNPSVVCCPGIANIMLCDFHCKRSRMPSSVNIWFTFGYAPKNMWRPVSIQSPSLSCHAETFPPKTSLACNITRCRSSKEVSRVRQVRSLQGASQITCW